MGAFWFGRGFGFGSWPGVCIWAPLRGDGDAQRRRVSGALRRCGKVFEHRQSDASFCRIPSPRASECTGAKRRRCARVSFSFAYFLLDKQKKVSRTAVRNNRCDELVSAATRVLKR
ncbi:MAG: hypothetical protein CMN26_16550 [Salinisphaera sp.]|nr:hypothetical protein [Salinisphaera sp.]